MTLRNVTRVVVVFAATTLWGQESTLSVTLSGIRVRFLTKVEPPGENARAQLPGGVIPKTDRAHHFITDKANKRVFGYDLRLESRGDGSTVQLWIEPLSIRNGADKMEPGWTFVAPPKYPVIPVLKLGDTVALDLLVNPATGQKVVDYLTVTRSGPPAPSGEARDFSAPDVELNLDRPRVFVNGKLAEATARYEFGMRGSVVWFYLEGHGRFILSLFPNEKLGFQKNGVADGDTYTFRAGSAEYRVQCSSPVAPGSGRYNLYVLHEAGWRLAGMTDSFTTGAAGNAEWIMGKH
jgi:hypothetical protein